MQKKTINFRLILVCLAAASVALPVALIGIAKFLLFICAIVTLCINGKTPQVHGVAPRHTVRAVLLALALLTLSLIWTVTPFVDALGSLSKYGKLLTLLILPLLIRNHREAIFATGAFLLGQAFLILSASMLALHIAVPWATSPMAVEQSSVFSSYLDQGIMFATVAAILWHLRDEIPGRFGKAAAIMLSVVALMNVIFVLNGRTGHVIAIALISLTLMWRLPRRYRLGAVVFPFLLLAAISFSSKKVHDRIWEAKTELAGFSFAKGAEIANGSVGNSSGIRLHFWHRAVQSIAAHPVMGSGIGSWAMEYNRIQAAQKSEQQNLYGGNPHEEYLLWGVQLGIPGIIMLVTVMLSILRDSSSTSSAYTRATQSALLALAVSCLFNSALYDALIGDFFCVLIGVLLALCLNAELKNGSGPWSLGSGKSDA